MSSPGNPPQGSYPPPPQGGYPPPGGYGGGGGYGGAGYAPGPMPDNSLGLSILAIFCCWPFAIPALINATQVQSRWSAGDYAGAQNAAAQARRWAMIAIILGIVWIVVVILFYVLAIIFGFAFFNFNVSTINTLLATPTPAP